MDKKNPDKTNAAGKPRDVQREPVFTFSGFQVILDGKEMKEVRKWQNINC